MVWRELATDVEGFGGQGRGGRRRTDGCAEGVDFGGEGVEFGCRVVDLRGGDLGAVEEEDGGGVGEGREAEEEEGGQLHGGGLGGLFGGLLVRWLCCFACLSRLSRWQGRGAARDIYVISLARSLVLT